MSLEIWIMNHPTRTIHKSIIEAFPNPFIHNDYEKDSAHVLIAILQKYYDNSISDYLLVIQDDVILGKNFKPSVEYIVSRGLNVALMSFYLPKVKRKKQKFHQYNPIKSNVRMIRGEGLLYPRSTVKIILDNWRHFYDIMGNDKADDYLISLIFLNVIKTPFTIPNPSFIQRDRSYKSVLGNKMSHTMTASTFDPNIDLLKFAREYY